MDKQHILNEIRRTAKENNNIPLGLERFYKKTGIRRTDWYGKYWARWGDALIEAGYKPNKLQVAYENDYVIEKMISLIRELGRYPVMAEVNLKIKQDKTFPTHGVFESRGKKAVFAKMIMEYCNEKDSYGDIIEICRPIAVEAQHEPTSSQEVIGYVYLLKSGRYYKIGRTTSMGRREYELSIQLPDKASKIHAIKTDDPVGIEAYWHKRFQGRRRNGEWFELTAVDVGAFKRRKFM